MDRVALYGDSGAVQGVRGGRPPAYESAPHLAEEVEMRQRVRVTLHGGPLDGMTWEQPCLGADPGAYMIVPGLLSRAVYVPDPPPADQARWIYRGMIG